ESADENLPLPDIEVGENLKLLKLIPEQHFTKPKPRYTEASLIKELEKLGIGRPSTYASIMSKIQDRNYTRREKKQLVPTELGFVVTDLLIENFPDILNVRFTAEMESELDKIEEGKMNWVTALESFYQPFARDLKRATKEMRIRNTPTETKCELCGANMIRKWGKNGFFLACSRFPECRGARNITPDGDTAAETRETDEVCDKCDARMVVKHGRYGEFLACPNYPECKNIKSLKRARDGKITAAKDKVTKEKCELCGKLVVERRSRYGKFLACSGYPECRYIKSEKTNLACPQNGCGGVLKKRRTKKGKTFYGCSNYPECNFATWNLKDLKKKETEPQEPNPQPNDIDT
ncbi:MAG: topoisomerase DNA-binding C4 zinc finger domain-containing protein, partial [Thermoplasmata archaeon]|nr:topoisomerase DNA-binding C4 zinc finger domain-containing protein [Thermoplasmata archaeon]